MSFLAYPSIDNPKHTIRRVLYLGAYEPTYARHRVIHSGLREHTIAINEMTNRQWLPVRWLKLAQAVRTSAHDVPIIVGESGNYLAPVLLEARRQGRPVLFDVFVSLCDTIEDRETGWRRTLLSPLMKWVDRINNWAAGAVLLDTQQTRTYFINELGLDPNKAHVAYVGAETDIFHPHRYPCAPSETIRVLFYGTFIPLQGIDTIVRAAAEVQRTNAAIRFQLIGNGQTSAAIYRLADQLRVRNIEFVAPSVPYLQLPQYIANADICLGIFADRPKTMRVIPNKLFQCAAMGKAVVTADTPAIREGFFRNELALVPAGDEQALAETILRLASSPAQRLQLGHAARLAMQKRFAPATIAAQVITACQAIYG